MIDELRERFRDRFVATARERIARGLEVVGKNDAAGTRSELHSLAGEAAMLGFSDVAEVAKEGESSAQTWIERQDLSAQVRCARILRSLGQLIEELATPSKEEAVRPNDASAKAKVLIIDDSRLVVDRLAHGLGEQRLDVQTATESSAGLLAIKAFRPDIVMVDINMPGVTFESYYANIRSLAEPQTKVVIVSGLTEAELASICEKVGADGYAAKQLGLPTIVDQICKLAEVRD